MKLKDLATTPKLEKLTINKTDLVEKYGDELDFYVYDRQPLDVYGKLANADKMDMGETMEVVSELILDEEGKKVCQEDQQLPLDLQVEAMTLIGNFLGKQQQQK